MIDPVALEIGSITVRWYGITMASAFIMGTILAYYRAASNKIDPDHILNLITLIIPFSIIGARIYYVIFEWENYAGNFYEIIAIWHGGLAIHGGIIGGIAAGLIYTRIKQLPPLKIADILSPSLILGQAIGRWGNFINQEAHGGPVSHTFINRFPEFIEKQMYINGQYYHPTFLYESFWDLLVFIILILRWPGKKFQGEIMLLYLALYSLGRFFIEAMRTDSLMIGPLMVAQLVSAILVIGSTAGLIYGHRCQLK
ncbi:MAG: prolipoprotein diacylglyceryl transferase [Clostridiales bacterium]|nr:prolipoprotein diacylglyceryl transferase [Clostridiales bacterium]MCF8022291.1 prolipoprotein diacylglyceryl transferase [Clostridiales bacterium]